MVLGTPFTSRKIKFSNFLCSMLSINSIFKGLSNEVLLIAGTFAHLAMTPLQKVMLHPVQTRAYFLHQLAFQFARNTWETSLVSA
jgi:hypothetical protein